MADTMGRTRTATSGPSAFLGSRRNVQVWKEKMADATSLDEPQTTDEANDLEASSELKATKGPLPEPPPPTKNQRRRARRKEKTRAAKAARLAEAAEKAAREEAQAPA